MTRFAFEWTPASSITFHAACNTHTISATTHEVRGGATVDISDGAIQLLPQPIGYIECDIDSLHSQNRLEDFEMRRQVSSKEFPTMRYDLRDVLLVDNALVVSGDLTFHGVTRPVTESCTISISGSELHLQAEHTFDVRDFDVEPPRILRLTVEPGVRITLDLFGLGAPESDNLIP